MGCSSNMNRVINYSRHESKFLILHTLEGKDIQLSFNEALMLYQDLELYYDFHKLKLGESITIKSYIKACNSVWKPKRIPLINDEQTQ